MTAKTARKKPPAPPRLRDRVKPIARASLEKAKRAGRAIREQLAIIRNLMRLESTITIPIFVAAWLVCAIGFSARAGWEMAKADDDKKREILATLLKRS